jgi:hypothetical protein
MHSFDEAAISHHFASQGWFEWLREVLEPENLITQFQLRYVADHVEQSDCSAGVVCDLIGKPDVIRAFFHLLSGVNVGVLEQENQAINWLSVGR